MSQGENDSVEHDVLAYLDGDLDAAEAESIRRQIDTDPNTRAIYTAYKKLYDSLYAVAPAMPAISSGVYPDIVETVDDAVEEGFADYEMFYGDAYRRISDELSDSEASAFDQCLSESHVHDKAFQAISAGVADLECAGDAYRKRSATIDITSDLMAAVQPVSESSPNVVTFARPRRWAQGLAAAALVLICTGIYYILTSSPEDTVPPVATTQTPPVEQPDPQANPDPLPTMDEMQEALNVALRRADTGQQSLPRVGAFTEGATPTETADEDNEEPILEMVALRRVSFDPLADPQEQDNALQKLLRFAAIGETSARRIATNPDTNPRIRAAVAKYLPSDEALSTLYAAILESPDDPYISFQLSVQTLEQQEAEATPEADAAAIEAALNFASTAPDNATAYLAEASARLAAGDTQGALEALDQARTAGNASTYAQETANLRAEAMQMADVDTDESTVASALTAGLEEYSFVDELSGDLLMASEVFLANGDAETATDIATTVYDYGQQLEGSAMYAFEQLAVIDLEHGVLGLFDNFRDLMLPDTESLEAWTGEAETVSENTDAISAVFNSLDAAFLALTDVDRIVEMAHGILGLGDLAVAESVESP